MIALNGNVIKPTMFPDGTSQVWRIELPEEIGPYSIVKWEFENEAEFMHLAQLKSLLDQTRRGVQLYLPYLPYGRQDKDPQNNQTFALFTFARLLNVLDFESVSCFDPHSSVANFLINKFYPIYPDDDSGRRKVW